MTSQVGVHLPVVAERGKGNLSLLAVEGEHLAYGFFKHVSLLNRFTKIFLGSFVSLLFQFKRVHIMAPLMAVSMGVAAGNITPILVTTGLDNLPCDNQMRFGWTVPLDATTPAGHTVVGTYLFANLNTAVGNGADIVIVSDTYQNTYLPPWPAGPASKWGTLGDLHMLAQPYAGAVVRQGVAERWFPAGDGVQINGSVYLGIICQGGGYINVYAVIWVK